MSRALELTEHMTRVYVAVPDGVFTITNGAAIQTLQGAAAQSLVLDESGRVYCGTWDRGLLRSDDQGRSWIPLGLQQVTSVSVASDGTLYAGTEPSALYRSEDKGATFTECRSMRELPSAPSWSFPPRPHTSHVRWITPMDGYLFVCIEAGALLRSADRGDTWDDRRPDGPFDTHTLREEDGRLYSSAGDGFMQPGRGFSVSDDLAETWARPGEGLREHYLWGCAVSGSTVIVSAAPDPQQAHSPTGAESTIYRRSGDGPFTESCEGLAERTGTNAWVLASEAGTFWAASNRGLYRFDDDGLSWLKVTALPGRANAIVVAS